LDFLENNIAAQQRKDILRFLLAHEIAHLTKRHGLKRLQRQTLHNRIMNPLMEIAFIGLGTLANAGIAKYDFPDMAASTIVDNSGRAGAMLLSQLGGSLSEVILKAYSRGEEMESDRAALSYLEKAGYDQRVAALFLQKLLECKEYNDHLKTGGTFSTHPGIKERISDIQNITLASNKDKHTPK
jgi:predicted Zn-dependent protease